MGFVVKARQLTIFAAGIRLADDVGEATSKFRVCHFLQSSSPTTPTAADGHCVLAPTTACNFFCQQSASAASAVLARIHDVAAEHLSMFTLGCYRLGFFASPTFAKNSDSSTIGEKPGFKDPG